MTWLDAFKLAIPLAVLCASIIWALIVYHGDGRWVRRPEVFDKNDSPRWALKETMEINTTMTLGQNDNIADHEERLIRLEERDVRSTLSAIAIKIDGISERVTRLEDVPRRLEAIETRITQNRLRGE